MAGDQQKLTEGASIVSTPAAPTPEPHPFIPGLVLCATCNAIAEKEWHVPSDLSKGPEQ
jgi:hypothetical protein